MKVEWVPIEEIKPNPKNPNRHSEEQIERLAKIIQNIGFRSPCIISRRSGFLVMGHGRRQSAIKAGLKKIPVIYQDFESEESEYQMMIADNAIAAWGKLDLSQINQDFLDLGPFDLDLLGLKGFVLEPADKPQKPKKEILCSRCREPIIENA